MDVFSTVLIGVIVILSIIFTTAYIPSVGDFYNRVASGQWFVVGAERKGDVLEIDVTAHHPKKEDEHPSSTPESSSTTDPSGFEKGTTNVPASATMPEEVVETPEVFLVQDGIYSYDEAEPLCRAYGARLATMGDLYDAWRKGADWCTYGWVKGNKAVYPTQKASWAKLQESDNKETRTKCGLPGLNGGMIRDRSRRFGVHCYGVKPPTWRNYLANTMAADNLTTAEQEERAMSSEFRRKLNQYTVAPFSKVRWSDVYKTPNDQDISSV
jgi:hypothetical protein